MLSFDVYYGRVVMRVPKNKTRKMKNAIPTIAFFLPDWTPKYVYNCRHYLSYTVAENYYKIYNPNGFMFDLDRFIDFIRRYHMRVDNVYARNFRVLEHVNR